MIHGSRYAWRSSSLGHFTDVDASCVLDLASTCHTGGWCFGARFGNWRVDYAPRMRLTPGDRYFCDAWWLSAEPAELDQARWAAYAGLNVRFSRFHEV